MKQYIDKSAIVAEIEKLIDEIYAGRPFDSLSREQQVALWYVKSIMSSIDTLEVKEEILDKEDKTKLMQKCVHEAYKRGYNMGAL